MRPILNSEKKRTGWALVVRGAMAILLGYACAAAAAMALARTLPLPRVDASLTATMASFIVYAIAAIWAFAARTVRHAATGLLLVLLLCAVIAWLPTLGAAR